MCMFIKYFREIKMISILVCHGAMLVMLWNVVGEH